MELAVSVGSLRRIITRVGVGVGVGLSILIAISPGAPLTILPVAAQEPTPTPKPPAFKPSGPEPSGGPASAPGRAAPRAGTPAPPTVAAGVFQSDLKDGRVFKPGKCPTISAGGDLISDGFRLVVIGPCFDDSTVADVSVPAQSMSVGDGDVAMDFKVVDGGPLATISVYVRNKDRKLIGASINAASGTASLFQTVEDTTTTLASRTDIGDLVNPEDWNRLALRVSGTEVWLLLNDTPALYATDVLDQAGGVGIREGAPDDDAGSIVAFRDLTLSVLDGEDPARAPTFPGP
jgi:hypothetical protein